MRRSPLKGRAPAARQRRWSCRSSPSVLRTREMGSEHALGILRGAEVPRSSRSGSDTGGESVSDSSLRSDHGGLDPADLEGPPCCTLLQCGCFKGGSALRCTSPGWRRRPPLGDFFDSPPGPPAPGRKGATRSTGALYAPVPHPPGRGLYSTCAAERSRNRRSESTAPSTSASFHKGVLQRDVPVRASDVQPRSRTWTPT